ncbi:MAG: hypothetical protein ACE1ZM_07930 [Gammaproteobacteria bacterium]
MLLRELIVLIICCFIYGCSDYPSGYKDGYGSIDKRQWIVFGRSEYLSGFEAGKAEKFQQDWLAENFSDINHLQCPVVTILADPLMFLPTEYKRVAPDTYQLDFQ